MVTASKDRALMELSMPLRGSRQESIQSSNKELTREMSDGKDP